MFVSVLRIERLVARRRFKLTTESPSARVGATFDEKLLDCRSVRRRPIGSRPRIGVEASDTFSIVVEIENRWVRERAAKPKQFVDRCRDIRY